ncbi:MAG: hypothetical protein ABI873_19245, partial [Marmoricola sp.]
TAAYVDHAGEAVLLQKVLQSVEAHRSGLRSVQHRQNGLHASVHVQLLEQVKFGEALGDVRLAVRSPTPSTREMPVFV